MSGASRPLPAIVVPDRRPQAAHRQARLTPALLLWLIFVGGMNKSV
jgi:hypothetical protein